MTDQEKDQIDSMIFKGPAKVSINGSEEIEVEQVEIHKMNEFLLIFHGDAKIVFRGKEYDMESIIKLLAFNE